MPGSSGKKSPVVKYALLLFSAVFSVWRLGTLAFSWAVLSFFRGDDDEDASQREKGRRTSKRPSNHDFILRFLPTATNVDQVHVEQKIKRRGFTTNRLNLSLDEKKYGAVIALQGRYETLLKRAELVGMQKRTNDGPFRTFTSAARSSFQFVDDEHNFFTSGERIFLLAPLLVDDEELTGLRTGVKHAYQANGTVRSEKVKKTIKALFPFHEPAAASNLIAKWVKSSSLKQPLNEVKDYFGEEIAFYFSFLGVYSSWLVAPAIFGTALFAYQIEHGFDNLPTALYALFLAIWATSFLEYWKRTQAKLGYKWDVLDYEGEHEEDTPAYRKASRETFNDLAGEYQYVLPAYKRVVGYAVSFLAMGGVIAAAVGTMLYFLALSNEAYATWKGPGWEGYLAYAKHLPLVAYSLLISVFGFCNKKIAVWTTRLECHRTESENRFVVIVKIVALQFINCYLSLFYTAFVIQDIDKLRKRLAFLFVTKQALVQILEVIVPLMKSVARIAKSTKKKLAASSSTKRVILECSLESYASTFHDYLEIWVQYGNVTLFAAVFPVAAVCALVSNAIEVRSDAFRLLRVNKRPFPLKVSGIGAWLPVFEVLGYVAVMTNVALVGIVYLKWGGGRNVPPMLSGLTVAQWVGALFAVEHVIVGLKFLLQEAIPDVDEKTAYAVRARKRKQELDHRRDFDIRHECMCRIEKLQKAMNADDTSRISPATSSTRSSPVPFEDAPAFVSLREEVVRKLAAEVALSGNGRGPNAIVEYCKTMERRHGAAVDAIIKLKRINTELKNQLLSPPLTETVANLATVASFAICAGVTLYSYAHSNTY